MKKRCSDCAAWEYQKNNFGFCRMNAPFPMVVKGSTSDEYILVWPLTGRDDYCWQFEAVRDLKSV
ncbi:MAG: hypothetical protein ACFFCW_00255 [Candidatus Hodarchaeota archaeon]